MKLSMQPIAQCKYSGKKEKRKRKKKHNVKDEVFIMNLTHLGNIW